MAQVQSDVSIETPPSVSQSQSQMPATPAVADGGGNADIPTQQPSLSDEINTATRAPHAHLNRQILSLLPLCLPPHTTTPAIYRLGLTHILPIYAAFEQAWSEILSPPTSASTTNPNPNPTTATTTATTTTQAPKPRPPLLSLLLSLHLPLLLRTTPLQNDIQALTPPSSPPSTPSTLTTPPSPLLQAFTHRITTLLPPSPHLLLAYTWIYYMALFSGGRHIRSQLNSAGPEFWASSSPSSPSSPPLSFLTFPTPTDGEDLKTLFKTTFASAEHILTPAERREVVRESVVVFEFMGRLVEELGVRCAGGGGEEGGRLLASCRGGGGGRDKGLIQGDKKEARETGRETGRGSGVFPFLVIFGFLVFWWGVRIR